MSNSQDDPQAHLDTDPVNEPDAHPYPQDDPAHDADEDEGWESEGGANPAGPATDT